MVVAHEKGEGLRPFATEPYRRGDDWRKSKLSDPYPNQVPFGRRSSLAPLGPVVLLSRALDVFLLPIVPVYVC